MLVYKGENYIVYVFFFLKVKNRRKKIVFKNCEVPLKSTFQNQLFFVIQYLKKLKY